MPLLRLAPENTRFGFMRFRRISYPFSAFLSIVSVVMFVTVGMNFGIDFAGGTLMEVRAKAGDADLAQLRSLGEQTGLGHIEVQGFGNRTDATVRFGVQPGGDAAQEAAVKRVQAALDDRYEFRRVESGAGALSA